MNIPGNTPVGYTLLKPETCTSGVSSYSSPIQGNSTLVQSTDWTSGTWLNTPPSVKYANGSMIVDCSEGSDFWRGGECGFTKDSGHALLTDLAPESSRSVSFRADFHERYDQAGVLVRVNSEVWVKAGIEIVDGLPHAAVVATRNRSDWSLWPVPAWADRLITVRATRADESITIHIRVDEEPWQMIRQAPLDAGVITLAGPMCCSPQRGGLRVTFSHSGPDSP